MSVTPPASPTITPPRRGQPRQRFTLILEPVGGADWRTPEYRLKGLLKVSLRRFGLRAVRVATANIKTDLEEKGP